jgi:hypothetical protein
MASDTSLRFGILDAAQIAIDRAAGLPAREA